MASSSVNDPSQGNSYQEDFSCSESNSESSATEEESDSDAAGNRQGHTPSTSAQCQKARTKPDQEEPCRYYNSGHCQDGKRCHYLHVCKYALKGNCRNGTKCRLKHPSSSSDRDGGGGRRERRRSSSGGRGRGGRRDRRRSLSGASRDGARERSSSRGTQLDFSGPYKWQLDDGHGWKDIANDHILEAQYSQPNTKGINIYNTPYGGSEFMISSESESVVRRI
ncbi:hypothetical protein J4Q44_G00141670 [Coregonus suidteri]|uniref:C3H1-type domain-containing protein n=1 Tax=Coregonus suidteri TaxID=861788 RepID=A0AAN8LLK6_9TELE